MSIISDCPPVSSHTSCATAPCSCVCGVESPINSPVLTSTETLRGLGLFCVSSEQFSLDLRPNATLQDVCRSKDKQLRVKALDFARSIGAI